MVPAEKCWYCIPSVQWSVTAAELWLPGLLFNMSSASWRDGGLSGGTSSCVTVCQIVDGGAWYLCLKNSDAHA